MEWDSQVLVLANNIDSVYYPFVPVPMRVMHKAEKAAQHLRVHLSLLVH